MGNSLVAIARFFGATTVSPDGYAYWAQAIATVAAIVVTIGLAFFQGWLVLRREAQHRRNVKVGLVRLAEHAADSIDKILDGPLEAAIRARNDNAVREITSVFANYFDVLQSVSLGELAKADVVWPTVNLRKCIHDAEHILGNCNAKIGSMPPETIPLLRKIKAQMLEMRTVLAA
jgi:hypothetical protein